MSIRIPALLSGGLITNYHCTSACKHCLYRSSPERDKGYVSREQAYSLFCAARSLGCSSMHVGGGEPFLNRKGLADVLLAARDAGVHVEYVETNSSWFRDAEQAREWLSELRDLGLGQILVSISPLHNEFIPLAKVEGVLEACERTDMAVFPWVRSFLADLARFDANVTHGMDEYEGLFGPGFLASLPDRYWVNWGGRAITTWRELLPLVEVEEVLARAEACRSLLDTTHFHMDLHGNYVPGMCAGLAVRVEDMAGELTEERYPLLNILVEEGVAGLARLAAKRGVLPSRERFMNKCDLCDDLRSGLVRAGFSGGGRDASPELAPDGFYA